MVKRACTAHLGSVLLLELGIFAALLEVVLDLLPSMLVRQPERGDLGLYELVGWWVVGWVSGWEVA